ncbi:MAG: TRAP transporter small permease [Hyphomicrobiaceae bacterium]
MTRLIDTISRWLSTASVAVSVVMFALMLAALTYQVVARYIFNAPPVWAEEFSMALFTWVVLLMGSVGVREGIHVYLDLWPDSTPWVIQYVLERFVQLVTLGVGLMLADSGWEYVLDTEGQVSAAINYPIEALHSAAPVAGVLITVHALAALLKPSKMAASERQVPTS